jgi:hypothetical protein
MISIRNRATCHCLLDTASQRAEPKLFISKRLIGYILVMGGELLGAPVG